MIGKMFDKQTMNFKNLLHKEEETQSDSRSTLPMIKQQTFVGTAEFISPEMLKFEDVSYEVDLWALGCIIYQMIAGEVPFKEKTEFLVYQKMLSGKIEFSEKFDEVSKDLVKQLLRLNPEERIGSEGVLLNRKRL